MPDEKAETFADAEFLEDILPAKRIAQEGVRDHVGKHLGILDLRELFIERLGHTVAAFAELGADAQHLRGQRLGFKFLRRTRGQRPDPRDRERSFLEEASELHPCQPLQDQVGSPIVPLHAGAHQADPGDVVKIRRRSPLLDSASQQRNAEHPLLLQGPGQHLPIARLEDVERQQGIGEEQCGQHHHGHVLGEIYWLVGVEVHGAKRGASFNSYVATGVVDFSTTGFPSRMPAETNEFEIVTVASGARSLRSREHGETFHPVVGPMTEARALHVEQQRLVERAHATTGEFVIWDVGLGAAANAIAVIEGFRDFSGDAQVELHSFDETTTPLTFALTHAETLGYVAPHQHAIAQLLDQGKTQDGAVRWHLHHGDFRKLLHQAPAPHAMLYDPYSPRANPELWTLEHFTTVFNRLDPRHSCLWSNYTRSTAVRVTLLLAGFFVGRGAATGEKEETTLASNDLLLIPAPLDRAWLQRAARSTRAAPLRSGGEGGPISATDFARLTAHPQFA